MSRVGKNPVVLPSGVEVQLGKQIVVKGPLGTLALDTHPAVNVVLDGQNLQVSKVAGAENGSAMWGTMRANLNNMLTCATALALGAMANVPLARKRSPSGIKIGRAHV
mgnify:CR=1 FL=1